jgi:HAD superfamily hydrolase (TIGR01549 family)
MSKLIFWDWTGTLADEAELDKAVCKTLEEEIAKKRNIRFADAIKLYRDHLKKLENSWHWHDYVSHCEEFGIDWRYCQEANLDKLKQVPGATEILRYARGKGYKNILATNAVRKVIDLRVGHLGMGGFFELVVSSSDVEALKVEGRHFQRGMEELGGEVYFSYSVGDNPIQDIRPAQKMGMRAIYCAYGKDLTHYHSTHISENHKTLVRSASRISKLSDIKYII